VINFPLSSFVIYLIYFHSIYVHNYEHFNNILRINDVFIRETSRTDLRPIAKAHLWHVCQRFRNNKHTLGPGNIRGEKPHNNQENALPTDDKLQKTIPNAQMRGRNYLTLIYKHRTSQNRIAEWGETKS
jgi:hypothetical protein